MRGVPQGCLSNKTEQVLFKDWVELFPYKVDQRLQLKKCPRLLW